MYWKISQLFMPLRLFKLLVIILLVNMSCKDSKLAEDQDLTGDITEVSLPDDFLPFLEKFSTDTLYQIDHIQWPLEKQLALSHPEDDSESVMLTEEEWKIQHAFDDMNGTYSQQFINFNGIITEVTIDKSGQYTMLRRFTKIDDKWKLIFYKEMGL